MLINIEIKYSIWISNFIIFFFYFLKAINNFFFAKCISFFLIFQNFRLWRILSFYEIEVFIWKFEHVDVYICLVGGVVIFDESWAGKGIDSRVNAVHGPVFSETEVNPAVSLTYSEHRLADIQCSTIGEPFECSIFCCGNWELMTDKLSEVLFLFIYK